MVDLKKIKWLYLQASSVELAREKENCKILKISQLKYFFYFEGYFYFILYYLKKKRKENRLLRMLPIFNNFHLLLLYCFCSHKELIVKRDADIV